ncbi:MAG TPA: stage II sporulation protein M [Firmicutes bacterium]|nr:stage II sporulation protein M [Bacillota bacterium]
MNHKFAALVRNNRSWLALAVCFFLGGFALAYTALSQDPELVKFLEETSLTMLQELGEEVFTTTPLQGLMILFLHNLTSVISIMFLGFFLGLPALFSALANGSVLGLVAFQLAETGVAPLPFLAAGVLPHGVFELPAFFISVALGLKLGYHLIFPLPHTSRGNTIRIILTEMGFSLPYLAGLLAVASAVEVLLTPLILTKFM